MRRTLFLLCGLLLPSAGAAPRAPHFEPAQTIPNPHGNDVLLAELSGDGSIDAFLANGAGDQALPSSLWINDGTGRFTRFPQDFGSAKTWCVASAPLRTGAANAIFLANGDWRHGARSRLWIRNAEAGYACSPLEFGTANSSAAAMADLDGDGTADLFLANHPYADGRGGECQVWLNDGRGTLVNSGQCLLKSCAPRRVKLADLNGDGAIDAIVLNARGQANALLLNDGHGRFSDSHCDLGQGENLDLVVGDLDRDGMPDLVVAKGAWGGTPKGVEIWHNLGAARFNLRSRLGDRDVYGVAVADLAGSGAPDIVAVCGPGQSNQLFENDGTGNFAAPRSEIGFSGNKVAIADLNRDGILDLFVVGDEFATVWIGRR
jgi:hypothetical protein